MKKPTLEERLNKVTAELSFFEEQNRVCPDRKLNKIIGALRAQKGLLEAIVE